MVQKLTKIEEGRLAARAAAAGVTTPVATIVDLLNGAMREREDSLRQNFNWTEAETGSILRIVIPQLINYTDGEAFEEISDLSDHFRAMKISLTINGISVDFESFITGLYLTFQDRVNNAAENFIQKDAELSETIYQLTKLHETLQEQIAVAKLKAESTSPIAPM